MRYRAPRAFCDRCDGQFYDYELKKQMVDDENGALRWSNWLVCSTCFDPVEAKRRPRPDVDPKPRNPPGLARPDR